MRQSATTVENNFVNGLITEATGLNFPESSVVDCDNVVFDTTGEVYRRDGYVLEPNGGYTTGSSSGVHTAYKWYISTQDGPLVFVVMQKGSSLFFYSEGDASLFSGEQTFTVDLLSYKSSPSVTDTEVEQNKSSFSSGNSFLFMAHKFCEPMYIQYDSNTDNIIVNTIELSIRDFEGVDDGLDIDERPTTLSNEHKYNLLNQSWSGEVQVSGTSTVVSPIDYWDNRTTDFPSNADVWWRYKDTNDVFNISEVNKFSTGTTEAPKGSIILNAFNRVREVDGTVIQSESSGNFRPENTEFYGGRIWWSGPTVGRFASELYFSRTIRDERDFGKCRQDNDPTSEFLNDLLPTDGGVIRIPDISRITAIKTIGETLIIFASNGIWAVSGADFAGFSADSYQVKKISEISVDSNFSIVSVEGLPVWWTTSGIYALTKANNSTFEVNDLSKGKIKDFYDDIPSSSKLYCQGVYDNVTKVITWVYRSSNSSNFNENFLYNRQLNLNTQSGAFYPFSLPNGLYFKCGINLDGNVTEFIPVNVTDGGVNVTDNGENITTLSSTLSFKSSVNKFFAESELINSQLESFWVQHAGEDEGIKYDLGLENSAFFVSGYKLRGEANRRFQSNYVTLTNRTFDNSGYLFSGQWDYSNSNITKEFTTRQQGYFHKVGTDFSQRRLRIRGQGKVLQYRVDSITDKNFYIAGWTVVDTVEGAP